jgi:hypothetical protein
MDSVCYVRFILPDAVSIEKLLLTNGAGTGGGGTACPHCGVIGCDGSCQGTNPLPCPHCGVVGCDGSCQSKPPEVDVDFEGLMVLIQYLIEQNQNQLLCLINLNRLLKNLLIIACLVLGSLFFIHFGRFVRW